MIRIIVQDASTCRVLKHPDHYDLIWKILSYNSTFKSKYEDRKLITTKASLFDKRNGSFPYGLLKYVVEKIEKKTNEDIEVKDTLFSSLPISKNISLKGIEFDPHQKRIINKIDSYQMGIIKSPTGSGKTIIIAGIIEKFKIPNTLVIVHSKNTARNVKKTLESTLEIPIGMIGNSQFDIGKVTVALYQSIKKITFLNEVELIIVDECHSAIEAIQNFLKPLVNIYYRFGLSATPIPKLQKEKWMKVTSGLGEQIIQITDKQAESRIVNDVKVYLFNFKYEGLHDNYLDSYHYDVLHNPERCNLICKMIKYAFIKKKIKTCILLVDEYKQAKLIKRICKEYKEIPNPKIAWRGSTNQDKIIKDLNSGKLQFVISTPVFSTGTDIPNVECVALGSARKSKINLIQKIGRGRRKTNTKNKLIVLDVYDNITVPDKKPWFVNFSEKRKKIYEKQKWKTILKDKI